MYSGPAFGFLPFLWHIVKYLVNIFEALTEKTTTHTCHNKGEGRENDRDRGGIGKQQKYKLISWPRIRESRQQQQGNKGTFSTLAVSALGQFEIVVMGRERVSEVKPTSELPAN